MNKELESILICPKCQNDVQLRSSQFYCRFCDRTFGFYSGVPEFFMPTSMGDNKKDVLTKVKQFYEKTPFPDYSEVDDVGSLIDKANESIFMKSLSDQIPYSARILEAGCGTGQLSNYLSIRHRMVIGTDISRQSLELAKNFKDKFKLSQVLFFQMNIFRPCFHPNSFHVVISNGVLHHTSDPKEGLRILATLTKKGGYLVIGLYHKFGRLITDIRRILNRLSGERLKFLDPRANKLSEKQKQAWFLDQYKHPHESRHTIQEVCGWLKEFNLDFIRSIPGYHFLSQIENDTSLFSKDNMGGAYERKLVELSFAFRRSQVQDGGVFVFIAKKM